MKLLSYVRASLAARSQRSESVVRWLCFLRLLLDFPKLGVTTRAAGGDGSGGATVMVRVVMRRRGGFAAVQFNSRESVVDVFSPL